MNFFVVIVTFSVLCDGLLASSLKQLMADEWTGFKLEHKKVYDSLSEEQYRFNVYLDNRDFIAKHNQRHALGLETYEMGVNHLADLTYEEILQQFAGFQAPVQENDHFENDNDSEQWLEDGIELGSFDWRQRHTFGPVKNQQQCGSCWAFSALTALEQHLKIHKGVDVVLSEQQLIDCTLNMGNEGCRGGWMNNAYKYIMKHGIAKGADYKYEARDGQCRYQSSMRAASIKSFKDVRGEANIQRTLESVGPLAVAVHVSRQFTFYRTGIFNFPDCSKKPNHAVVTVGHGQQGNDQYWIVQNSWGASWGDKGYILMSKNKDNQCAIDSYVSYPVV